MIAKQRTAPAPDAQASRVPSLCDRSRISLSHLPQRERLDAWQSLFKGAHAISAEEPDCFHADLASVAIDAMIVHRMDAAPQAVTRDRAMIRRDGMDHVVLHLCADPMRLRVDDNDINAPGGAVTVNDMTQPYRRAPTADRNSISVVLARDLVAPLLAGAGIPHGAVLRHGTGALLCTHMQTLGQAASHVTREAAAAMARATADLFVACLLSTPDLAERARAPLESAALIRAKCFINDRLGDAALTPERIAQAAGVSRATLFRLFAPEGGVVAYLQERRLTAIRRTLASRRPGESIAAIGYRFGFSSDVVLSRAFRRKFGVAPRDLRTHAETMPGVGEGGHLVTDWLSRFG
jgi:AraC-like DNA-binding protein